MTSPTNAAFKAADKIIDKSFGLTAWALSREQLAMLIDKETGLPDLLAACEAALSELVDYGPVAPGDPAYPIVDQLRVVIAKATGK